MRHFVPITQRRRDESAWRKLFDLPVVEDEQTDPLAPARGIVNGFILGACFWAIPLIVWYFR